jgi:hypothetical protein
MRCRCRCGSFEQPVKIKTEGENWKNRPKVVGVKRRWKKVPLGTAVSYIETRLRRGEGLVYRFMTSYISREGTARDRIYPPEANGIYCHAIGLETKGNGRNQLISLSNKMQ